MFTAEKYEGKLMYRSGKIETAVSGPGKERAVEPFRTGGGLSIGIDVGSTSSDIVVIDDKGHVIVSDYRRTMARPVQTVQSQLEDIFKTITPSRIKLAAATGSAGRLIAELLEIEFVNEVQAQAQAICRLYQQLDGATVIEMGGQDSKLIFLARGNGRLALQDFALNTVCAAGTGSFLDQQAQRLGVKIEDEFGDLALKSKNTPRMAGRCSVFAKSDMIHLQQQATDVSDIIAGLCLALGRSLKSNLGAGREFTKPIIFTGGVAANIGVVRAFEKVFGLEAGQIIVPKDHFFTGAMGAVISARKTTAKNKSFTLKTKGLDDYLAKKDSHLKNAPRREPLAEPSMPVPESIVYEHLLNDTLPVEAYLGVDVGSISTNVVVMDRQKRVLAKAYLMTAGRPLEAVRKGLQLVGEKTSGKVKILGAATTGSGRYLTGDFIGADVVINEITAQAAGAAIVHPQVDTIFEIGGQDSKYISLENGVVVDFEMNHACAAGTGSFLEEQAQRLGIKINKQFAELAFKSKEPIKLGERCTVFIESDLQSFYQQGASVEDLTAGLSYSIVTNYLNRLVGRRKIGDNICFQGGTAFNKAVWSAFEKVSGKSIVVPDHHEVTGALGAAAIAARQMEEVRCNSDVSIESTFRGFDNLINTDYSVESFTCEHCANACEVKKVELSGSEPLYYGSRCDRYNLKKKKQTQDGIDAFEYRNRMLLHWAGVDEKSKGTDSAKTTIGIPRALVNWELLPLFSRFFKSLGFDVALSGKTNRKIIRAGVESVTAETCFPVKVAYGHVAELIAKEVDYIFLPSIVSMFRVTEDVARSQLCPYVQSFAYQVSSAFEGKMGKSKILTCPIRLGEGQKLIDKSFIELAEIVGVNSASAVRKAVRAGMEAQKQFTESVRLKGSEIIDGLTECERLFVLISRPYNGCDEALSLSIADKLRDIGVKLIPMDMLDIEGADGDVTDNEFYWTYGQKILRAGRIIKQDRRLFAVYLSNFSCGPDSFITTFFKETMRPKPCLNLELDEHSADAGLITRLEAFVESLRNYKDSTVGTAQKNTDAQRSKKIGAKRTLYIPYMSDSSFGMAACFRSYGQPAEVMGVADESMLVKGRKFTSGKECLPCAITASEMLNVIDSEGFKADKAAFFMPSADGPCRFGMYNCMHKLILKYAGAADAVVIAPDQGDGFYKQLVESTQGSSKNGFMKNIWQAAVGSELLGKVILKVRPFAKDPMEAQAVYDNLLQKWCELIEKRSSLGTLCEFIARAGDELESVELDRHLKKPTIGIVGEIYVRSHPFANNNIIQKLESLGAACELAAPSEWIYYTNVMRSAAARRGGTWKKYIGGSIGNYMQRRIEKKLGAGLEKRFGNICEEPTEHLLELAAPYIHESFEGEAVLSVGKMVELYHKGAAGVVNVMPFGCMPSTIVSSQTRQISNNCGGMGILNLSFDGQSDPALMTRLEAFVEQVRQRQFSKSTAASVEQA